MAKTVLKVEGMSCGHCAQAVVKAVTALPGVAGAAVDLAAKTVTVEHDPDRPAVGEIKAGIEEQGYEVVG